MTSAHPKADQRAAPVLGPREGAAAGMRLYVRQVGALLWKDLVIELRTKDVVLAMLFFGLLSLTVFVFAFELRTDSVLLVSPGVLWVSLVFACTLGLGRSYSQERERGSMEGLLLCPMDRSAVFVAKFLTNVAYMLLTAAALTPVFGAFFGVSVLSVQVIAVILLGIVGLSAVGTVFGAMAVNTRAREVTLPVLLFPVLVPVVIAAVKATGLFMDGQSWSAARPWISLLVGFDLVYIVLSFVLYEFVIEDWS